MELLELPYFSDSRIYFSTVNELPQPMYLDSQQSGQFDIITADPIDIIQHQRGHNPFEYLKTHIASWKLPYVKSTFPFTGGALGYFAYDLARELEKLPTLSRIDTELPDMFIGIYDWAMIVDHKNKTAHFIYRPQIDRKRDLLYEDILAQLQDPHYDEVDPDIISTCKFTPNIHKDNYAYAFNKIQNYLYAGDVYEVCYTQRFSGKTKAKPWALYQSLRHINPAPFSAFLQLNSEMAVLCTSPERFLEVREKKVETKPIKGTRPRGKTEEDDRQLYDELAASEKDRAENLMIVDLLRNDLGKCCKPGSIQVEKLFAIESHSNVHHMVSTIKGILRDDVGALDLLSACFPGGSITGAPKIRSMEIIEELEPQRRNVYCGSIGYIDFNGNMDTNIAIRTLIYDRGNIHCSAGGAIVVDSEMESEYQESLDKVSFLF